MFSFFKTKKRHTLMDKEAIRSEQSEGVRYLIRIIAIIALLIVAVIVSVIMTLPRDERSELEKELSEAKRDYEQARQIEDKARKHYLWLSDDEYFEQIIRDRENLALDGETVIRIIERDIPVPTPLPEQSIPR